MALTEIQPKSYGRETVECEMARRQEGRTLSFPVSFVRDYDGVWRVKLCDEMMDYGTIVEGAMGDEWKNRSDAEKAELTDLMKQLIQKQVRENLKIFIAAARPASPPPTIAILI